MSSTTNGRGQDDHAQGDAAIAPSEYVTRRGMVGGAGAALGGLGALGLLHARDAEAQLTDPAVTRSEMPVNVKDYGAKGNGTADDTIAIRAAIAALPANGGTVFFPRGTYKLTGTLTISKHSTHLVGEGGPGRDRSGATLLDFSGYNGKGIHLNGSGISGLYGCSIQNMMLQGTRTSGTSQDLIYLQQAHAGRIVGVGCIDAGHNNLVVNDCQEWVYDRLSVVGAQTFNILFDVDGFNNVHTFVGLICRVSQDWGIRILCGDGINFFGGVVESNNQNRHPGSGGILLITNSLTKNISASLFGVYFENNSFGGGGWPILIEDPQNGGGQVTYNDYGLRFAEAQPCECRQGQFASTGLIASVTSSIVWNFNRTTGQPVWRNPNGVVISPKVYAGGGTAYIGGNGLATVKIIDGTGFR
jgi:Pectate lyase superfamily protein